MKDSVFSELTYRRIIKLIRKILNEIFDIHFCKI